MARALRVLRLLKRGPTADVLEAEETQEGGIRRHVVLKRLRPDAEAELEAAFLDEARVLAQLAHAGIVRFFGIERLEGTLVQMLEPIEGRDLEDAISAGVSIGSPIPLSVALHVAVEVARALDYVHQARDVDGQPLGIVHRDVTPANVMLAQSGDVRLIDFGVASSHRSLDQTGTGIRKGTPAFMAPEQWLGAAVDRRADLFATGGLIYFMLTGAPPFPTEKARAELTASRSLPSLDRIPEAARPLLARALAFDPAKRFGSAREILGELVRLLRRTSTEDGQQLLAEWLRVLEAAPVAPSKVHPLEALFAPTKAPADPLPPLTAFLDPREAATEMGESVETMPTFDASAEASTVGELMVAPATRSAGDGSPASALGVTAPTGTPPEISVRTSPIRNASSVASALVWGALLGLLFLAGSSVTTWCLGRAGSPGAPTSDSGLQRLGESPPRAIAAAVPTRTASVSPSSSSPPREVNVPMPKVGSAAGLAPEPPTARGRKRRPPRPTSPQPDGALSDRVKASLDRFAETLRTGRSALAASEVREFEARYFDLRVRYDPESPEGDARDLEAEIRSAQHALDTRLSEGLRPLSATP